MSYIPTKDAELGFWANNFQTLIVADPARYGLLPADGAALRIQYDIFTAAYNLAINPTTKTTVTVADKDGEKVTLLAIFRTYAALIRANGGVTDEDKVALGLTLADPTPTPIPAPTTSPKLIVTLCSDSVHQLNCVDSQTPTKKAKPYGVVGAQLCLLVDNSPYMPDMTDAVTVAIVTKADFVLDVSAYPAGNFAHYRARWFNSKGEFGPWGSGTTFVIPVVSEVAAAA